MILIDFYRCFIIDVRTSANTWSRQYGAYASADLYFDIDSSKYNKKYV